MLILALLLSNLTLNWLHCFLSLSIYNFHIKSNNKVSSSVKNTHYKSLFSSCSSKDFITCGSDPAVEFYSTPYIIGLEFDVFQSIQIIVVNWFFHPACSDPAWSACQIIVQSIQQS